MKKLIMIAFIQVFANAAFSQMTMNQEKQPKTDNPKTVKYTCPMDADVISDKPGKCPKCGMTLVVKKAESKKTYVCPMDADVSSDKPGTCPKCGMNLVEKKKK
jgi:hypothetical protein